MPNTFEQALTDLAERWHVLIETSPADEGNKLCQICDHPYGHVKAEGIGKTAEDALADAMRNLNKPVH
jgi:hypothetical protein